MKYKYIVIIAVFFPLTLQAGSMDIFPDKEPKSKDTQGQESVVTLPSAPKKSSGKAGVESIVVPPSVLENILVKARIKKDRYRRTPPKFSGRIFNESRWVITSITIAIFPIEEIISSNRITFVDKVSPVDEVKRKELTQSCTSGLDSYVWPNEGSTFEARPLTEAKFDCPEVYAQDRMNYSWQITSAKGFRNSATMD
jgi:hypothetical protein